MTQVALPIDALLPDVVQALERHGAVVLEAPPGAGKTTRVPAAMLNAGFATQGEILVLQPRRLPARLAAERVAFERGERVGQTIGYTIRFEDASGPNTRVRFVTEGVLTRRLVADPLLRGVCAVVLDEFHERHLATDLALGMLRELRRGPRPDLRVCVMSATLDAGPVAEFLDDSVRLRSEGRLFEVAVEHARDDDGRPLAAQVAGVVKRLALEGLDGDVLVFLPGAGEIRRAAEALQGLARERDLLVLPLHGELPVAEQNRAVQRADRRKVILSTNVAETSVTIDGVVAVVDGGLARLASHSPWTGLPLLRVGKVSQASAIQRAGRAGRTRPGRAIRLFTRHDFEARRAFDAPEIERMDLSDPLLALAAAGVRRPEAWGWFERPPGAALGAASQLLRALGAIASDGALTETGRQMLRFPVHPRLARLLVEAERREAGAAGASLCALLSERDVRERSRVSFGVGGPQPPQDADLLGVLDAFEQARAARFDRGIARGLGLDLRALEAAERVRRQLARIVRAGASRPDPESTDRALALATLAAFPDRVARRRSNGREVVMAQGGAAAIGPSPPGDLMVAVDAEEREGSGRGTATVRLAVSIEAEALLEVEGGALAEGDELVWNAQTERVDRVVRLSYGAVILEETRKPAPPSAQATAVLVAAVRAAGASAVVQSADVGSLPTRLAVLAEALPEAEVPRMGAGVWDDLVVSACEGRTSFAELRAADVVAEWLGAQPPRLRELLRSEAPDSVRLPGGRVAPVHYDADRPPWIESRLQDFFGLATGPAICKGRVPLTLHLLAPNGRAVQVTRDLTSFWRVHYPPLRRELGRRYPRHAWPEDGATATPPPPHQRRR